MQANKSARALKWLYFAVLAGATVFGAWKATPWLQQERINRAASLQVHVYSHPHISIFKDMTGGGRALGDPFFKPNVFSEATAEIMQQRAAPLAKGTDSATWSQQFASDLTMSMNNYMSRNYSDLFNRLEVIQAAKGAVLVRIENVSSKPVEEVKIDVNGGQVFMEGSVDASRFRSLGTKLLRIPVIKPGEKNDFYVLTTQDMSLGGTGPRVQVSSKDQTFPIVVHAQDAPLQPTTQAAGWIAFATLYATLILGGLSVKMLSFMGLRFGVLTENMAVAAALPGTVTPTPAQAPRSDMPRSAAELKAWQGPKSL